MGSSIIIGGDIKIQVVQIKGRQVRLGIEAPKETKVHREEVQRSFRQEIRMENREQKSSSSDYLSL